MLLVKAAMQTLRAVGLTVGVDIQVQHVHLMEGSYQNTVAGHDAARTRVHAVMPYVGMHRPASYVLRLIPHIGGGAAAGGGPCVVPGTYRVGRAGFQLVYLPTLHGDATRAQEAFHTILLLRHTPCYGLEQCPEPKCWNGKETVCTDTTSFMGYCMNSYCPLNRLEFGGRDNLMWNVARDHANKIGSYCLEAPTEWADLADRTDTDGDGVPDWHDNCPAEADYTQWDRDDDGRGDACDGCTVGPPGGVAWPLLGPLLLSWGRRRLTTPR
jgi:hypothetical protein